LLLCLGLVGSAGCSVASELAGVSPKTIDLEAVPLETALANGKPTLAEFGGRTCIPCKQMKPILEEIALKYEGNLNVVIIEANENAELSRFYRITTIPTQIFFDETGFPIGMHVGVLTGESIEETLEELGIEPTNG